MELDELCFSTAMLSNHIKQQCEPLPLTFQDDTDLPVQHPHLRKTNRVSVDVWHLETYVKTQSHARMARTDQQVKYAHLGEVLRLPRKGLRHWLRLWVLLGRRRPPRHRGRLHGER